MGSKVVMELCNCPECDCQYVGAGSECKKCLVNEHHAIDGLPHWLIVEHIPYEPLEWKTPDEPIVNQCGHCGKEHICHE